MNIPTTSTTAAPRLLIIDSGVGGLSVLQQVRELLPQVSSTYIADNAHYPYGTKTADQVVERVASLASSLLQRSAYAALIVACNTASTVALPHLRALLNIPVIGVVPAIKPAAQVSRTKVIGLLATPGTIERDYTQQLIRDFASDCTVLKVGSCALVDLVERGLENNHIEDSALADILQAFWQQPLSEQLDTIVLGCTHFPLFKTQLMAAAPQITHWIDSGEAIARQVARILQYPQDSQQDAPPMAKGTHELLFTAPRELNAELRASFKKYGIAQISLLDNI